jgi:bifunctional DNase/RNase
MRSDFEEVFVIPVELSRIVIRETSDQQYIYLQEKDGDRSFPIIIGIFEALEINRKISEITSIRPMTHDLIRNILEAVDAELSKIVITDLRKGTFYANLYLVQNGKELRVDSRPSDAIALASALKAPIFVEEKVMDQVVKPEGQEDDDIL